MGDWKINRAQSACGQCEKPFEDQQRVVSAVELDDEEVPVRRDYCSACFGKERPDVFFWETRWTAPAEGHKKKIDFNRLLRLFEAWLETRPPGQDALLYLIGLLLVRKRFFRMLDLVSEGGEEFLRLRRPGPEQQAFLVPAPLLDAAALPALRARLELLIDGDFDEDDVPDAAQAAHGPS